MQAKSSGDMGKEEQKGKVEVTTRSPASRLLE
jgi:hypothetical protein